MELLKLLKTLTVQPKNAQELKGVVLQLAVQGKLTKKWRVENPDVEPASELLKRIQEEKERLIKEKKIRKEKSLPIINREDVRYEIPDNWNWCRLNDISTYIQRGKSPKYTEISRVPVVSQKCVQWSGFDISRVRFITIESLEKYVEERFLLKGDLLWNSTGNGTVGRVILYPGSEYDKIVADSHVTVVRVFKNYIDVDYLWIFTASPFIQNIVSGRVTGSTKQTELGTGTVKSMEFSLPPLEEQKEIVRIVNNLLEQVAILEEQTQFAVNLKEDYITSILRKLTQENTQQTWQELIPQFKTYFTTHESIKKLRASVLQLAVQGKLTKKWRQENTVEETARELLEKIKAEKAQLIKEKKIKKEKPLPPFAQKEIPFEVPESWVWCRINNITIVGTGATPLKSNKLYYGGSIPWYTSSATNEFFTNEPEVFITEKALKETNCKIYPKGTLIVAMYGQGKTRGQVSEIVIPGATNQAISALVFINSSFSSKYFIKCYFQNIYVEIRKLAEGGAQPNLSVGKIKSTIVPFPPIEEQKAIVQKVNELMRLCDALEETIKQNTQQSHDLMQSCIREIG